jgi:hypothetical protein
VRRKTSKNHTLADQDPQREKMDLKTFRVFLLVGISFLVGSKLAALISRN